MWLFGSVDYFTVDHSFGDITLRNQQAAYFLPRVGFDDEAISTAGHLRTHRAFGDPPSAIRLSSLVLQRFLFPRFVTHKCQ